MARIAKQTKSCSTLVLVEPIHGLDGEHIVVGVDADVIAGVNGLVWLHGGRILAVLRRASDVVVEDDVVPACERQLLKNRKSAV